MTTSPTVVSASVRRQRSTPHRAPRQRAITAPALASNDTPARIGCTGAHTLNAPETPKSDTAILLHTGHPTASALPTTPNTLRTFDDRARGAASIPAQANINTAIAATTPGSHHRTGVIRVKNPVSITSVGTPTTTTVSIAATSARGTFHVTEPTTLTTPLLRSPTSYLMTYYWG